MSASSSDLVRPAQHEAGIQSLAEMLDNAALTATAIPQLDVTLSLTQAYAVQAASISLRQQRGERLIGIKMGFTSRAKMVQMGVSDVIWGRLTDAMRVADGGSAPISRFVHPRVEPEIVFRLKSPLRGRITSAQALAAVDGIAAGLEIIDSRFEAFKFSLTDVVADNASSSGFVVGPWSPADANIEGKSMVMSFDGKVQAEGSTTAILDHPVNSLIAAARLADENDLTLEPGWIVLAGGATAAAALAPGVHVSLAIAGLAGVGFKVEV